MSKALNDKVIAITGAASGIGLATARECAARGAQLALSDLNIRALESSVTELKASYPDLEVHSSKLDVSKSSEVDTWVTSVVQHFGRIDGACNIAGVDSKPGIPSFQSIVNTTDEHWLFVQDINLNGVFYCVRAQLRVMQKGGSIVNAASTAGVRGTAQFSAYCASKHGVVGLTKSAAKEGGPLGIRVNAVCPGPVDTPLLRRMAEDDPTAYDRYRNLSPMKRLGTIDEVAKIFCHLLSDDASWISGTTSLVDGGSS